MSTLIPNYTPIPNSILGDVLAGNVILPGSMVDLDGKEIKVFLALCRATFGIYQEKHKKTLSISDLQVFTGLSRQDIIDAANRLENEHELTDRINGNISLRYDHEDQFDTATGRLLQLCRICHLPDQALEKHHIIPKQFGGKDIKSNLFSCCFKCHKAIHDEIRAQLKTKNPSDELFINILTQMVNK